MTQTPASNKGLIAGIVAITVLIFGGLAAAIYFAPGDQQVQGAQDEQVSFDDSQSPSVGPLDAKVVVRMYSDFQCPACRSAEPGVKAAMEKYADKVRFIWKDFPLSTLHRNARLAADAARCAEDQTAFWRYRTKLYDMQTSWEGLSNPKESFVRYAQDLGLNVETFTSCLNTTAEDAKVAKDISEGTRNNVDSTPTFFVNNRRYHGMAPPTWFNVIDEALARVATGTVSGAPSSSSTK